MNDYFAISLGIACAGIGGELFVRGSVGLARWACLSPGLIGATVAAFATSSPELTVSVTAALGGKPQIALGDSVGSNMVNVALIFGLALLMAGMRCPRDSVKRDFPAALAVPCFTGLLAFDGVLSRLDGLFLLSVFIVWLVAVIIEARKQHNACDEASVTHRGLTAALLGTTGFIFLVIAGRLIVTGATGIAISFGIDAFIIGATIVAVSTSAPELATTLVARLRQHDDVALGTILGSNIFNGLLIVSVAAIISPITIARREVIEALMFGLVGVALTYPSRGGVIKRWRGILLVLLYALYLVVIVHHQHA
jgi:cation:H+ antiporter